MSSIPIDLDKSKMRLLLRDLSLEKLNKEGAQELKPLLLKESQITTDLYHRKTLFRLIDILDKYIKGEINLMPELNVSVANV